MDVFGPAFKMLEVMLWFLLILVILLAISGTTILNVRETDEEKEERKRIDELKSLLKYFEDKARLEGKTVDQILDEMRNRLREENSDNS